MKKFLSFVLCAVMLFGVIPFTQKAAAEWIDDVIYEFDFSTNCFDEGWEIGGTAGGSFTPWEQLFNNDLNPSAKKLGFMYSDTSPKTDAYLYSPWFEVWDSYEMLVSYRVSKNGYYNAGYIVEGSDTIIWFKNSDGETKLSAYDNYGNFPHEFQIPSDLAGQNIRFVIRNYKSRDLDNALRFDEFKVISHNSYHMIKSVDIRGVGSPYPNTTASTVWELEAEDDSYYPAAINWHRKGVGKVTKFEPGGTYYGEIIVAAADGYAFEYTGIKGLGQFDKNGVTLDEDTDYVDYDRSVVVMINQYESAARLYIYTPEFELPLYDELELNGTPVALVGQSASGTPTRVYSANNGDYTVLSANWYKHSGGSYTEYNGVFKEGEKYAIKVVIAPRGYASIASGAVVKTTLGDATGTLDKTGRYTVYLPDITPKVAANLKRGKCGGCTWTFDTASGQMTVTGTGEFYPAACWDCDIMDYVGDVKSLIIDEGITSIGDSTFMECNTLEKVWLADSITEVSYDCFQWCENLTELKLPANLEYVGNSSFSAIGVTELTLPDSLRIIDKGAFSYLNWLTSLTLNDGLEEIGAWAFSDCEKLKEASIPASLNRLGDNSLGVDGSGKVYKNFTLYVYYCTPAEAYANARGVRRDYNDALWGCHVTGSAYPFEQEISAANRMTATGSLSTEKTYELTLYTDTALTNAEFSIKMLSPDLFTPKTDGDGDRYFAYDESCVGIKPYESAVTTSGAGKFTITFNYGTGEITVEGNNVVPQDDNPPEALKGDCNGDGNVNNKDVVALFKYVSGGNTEYISAYDFTGDGSINNKDVVALFKYVSA